MMFAFMKLMKIICEYTVNVLNYNLCEFDRVTNLRKL